MSLGTILLIVLILMLIGVMPSWPHSRNWGYGPSGGLGLVVIIIIVLLLMGRLSASIGHGAARLSGCEIEFKPEHAAHTHCALHAHIAVHQFDQPLAHGQTDAGALGGSFFLALAVEGLKKLAHFFGR